MGVLVELKIANQAHKIVRLLAYPCLACQDEEGTTNASQLFSSIHSTK
jgi:hypothetical protein